MEALVSFLNYIIGILPSLGVSGTILGWIVAISGLLAGLVTAVNLIWQGVVKILQALALIPGLSSLNAIANTLMADEASLQAWENSYLIPILNQLSTIVPPPSANKSSMKKE